MKVKLDLQLTMGDVDPRGTGFQGYLPEGTTYRDIVRVFGEPQLGESDDKKIKAEWVGKINGLIFTIYDYKSKVVPEENTDWHIGGKVKLVAELVNEYFKVLT